MTPWLPFYHEHLGGQWDGAPLILSPPISIVSFKESNRTEILGVELKWLLRQIILNVNVTTCLELILAHFSLQVAGGPTMGKVPEDGVGVDK